MAIFTTYEEAAAFMAQQVEKGYKCQMRFELDGVRVDCKFELALEMEKQAPKPPTPQPTLTEFAPEPEAKPLIRTSIKQGFLNETTAPSMELPVELRDYQKEAVAFALAHPHCIIELPTGRGKTMTALAIVNELIRDFPLRTVLVIVPTSVLLTQWIDDGFAGAGVEATGVSGEGKVWSRYTVTTYQSAIRNLEQVSSYDIVVFDEVHHLFAPEYSNILQVLLHSSGQKYLIGLTATVRTIGEGMVLQYRYFPDVFSKPISEFQQSSETRIPVRIFAIPINFSDTEREAYDRFQKTISRANKEIGPMPDWVRYTRENTPKGMLARQALVAYANQNTLLATVDEKVIQVVKIVQSNPGQFIVFSDSVEQMQKYEEALSENGIAEGTINGKTRASGRSKIIAGLKDKTVRVLVGGNAITEGLDLPDISNGILSSFLVKEPRTLIQRVGRLMRPKEGKTVNIWLVYVSNTKEERNALNIERILGEEIRHSGGL